MKHMELDHIVLITTVFNDSAETNAFVSQGKNTLFHKLQETEIVNLHVC
jgi:hypothetical protein